MKQFLHLVEKATELTQATDPGQTIHAGTEWIRVKRTWLDQLHAAIEEFYQADRLRSDQELRALERAIGLVEVIGRIDRERSQAGTDTVSPAQWQAVLDQLGIYAAMGV